MYVSEFLDTLIEIVRHTHVAWHYSLTGFPHCIKEERQLDSHNHSLLSVSNCNCDIYDWLLQDSAVSTFYQHGIYLGAWTKVNVLSVVFIIIVNYCNMQKTKMTAKLCYYYFKICIHIHAYMQICTSVGCMDVFRCT